MRVEPVARCGLGAAQAALAVSIASAQPDSTLALVTATLIAFLIILY
jgi:hypothetical protein